MTLQQSTLRNLILSRMEPDDFALLAAHLEPVDLPQSLILTDHDDPVTCIHFLENGVTSIVGRAPSGRIAETGFIGFEGFVHPAPLLGGTTIPNRLEMQIAGHGYRLSCEHLLGATRASPRLLAFLLRFVQALIVQVSFTALSNATHHVDVRLARWLLMCHDRMDSADLHLTHHFMAVMLTVRRPSVTDALHVLEGDRLISTERGYITVLNRAGLEDFASDAYGAAEKEYASLLGPLA